MPKNPATFEDLEAFGERIRKIRLAGAGKANEVSLVDIQKELTSLREIAQKTMREVESLMDLSKTPGVDQNKIMETARQLKKGLESSYRELEMLSITKIKNATPEEVEDFSLSLEEFRSSARLDFRRSIRQLDTIFSVKDRLTTLQGELAHWQSMYRLTSAAEKSPTFQQGIVGQLQKTALELDELAQKSSAFDHTQEIANLKQEIQKFIEPLKPQTPVQQPANLHLATSFAASTTAIEVLNKEKNKSIATSASAPVSPSPVEKKPEKPRKSASELFFERPQKRTEELAAMLAKAEAEERMARERVLASLAEEDTKPGVAAAQEEASSAPVTPKTPDEPGKKNSKRL